MLACCLEGVLRVLTYLRRDADDEHHCTSMFKIGWNTVDGINPASIFQDVSLSPVTPDFNIVLGRLKTGQPRIT